MKKTLWFAMMMLMFSFVANTAIAEGIKYDSLSVGAEYSSGERDMKLSSGSSSFTFGGTTVSGTYPSAGDSVGKAKAKEQNLFVKGSVKMTKGDKFADLYAKIGMAKLNYSYTFSSPGSPDEKDEFDGDNSLVWAIGFSGQAVKVKNVSVLIDAEYSAYDQKGAYNIDGKSTSDTIRQAFLDAGYTSVTSSYSTETKVSKWHAGLTAATTLGRLTPHVGVRYSVMEINNTTNVSGTANGTAYSGTGVEKFKADKNVGAVIGTGVNIIKNLDANIEGHFIDETSGRVGVKYKF